VAGSVSKSRAVRTAKTNLNASVEILPATSLPERIQLPDDCEATLAGRMRVLFDNLTRGDLAKDSPLMTDPRIKARDALVLGMISDAVAGDANMRREIFARLDGKYPTLAIEVPPEFSVEEFHREADKSLIQQLRTEVAELKAALEQKQLAGAE
jgi:hypothetical protein